MREIVFEDLIPGTVTTYGGETVTAERIVAFAREFDAQPFHLGEESARGTFAGRLIASGWHTIALLMRMLCDEWLVRAAALGSPGIDKVEWLQPVLPGDTLRVRQTIVGARASKTRPWMGVVQFRFEVLNAAEEVVMRQENPILFARRDGPAEPPPPRRAVGAPDGGLDAMRPRADGRSQMGVPFEELEVGATDFLGAHRFAVEEVVRFARAFDPQPFHLDDDAARRTHFGRLAASGWHTAAMWMRQLVRAREDAIGAAGARGSDVPTFGPSPGLTALRWLQPVYPGDTIRFATTLTGKRALASRPGWGISFSHNTGWNQDGTKVFEFAGTGFIATGTSRPA